MFHKILLFVCGIVSTLIVSKAVLTPEDENFYGVEADRIDWSKHPCNRPCVDGAEPKTCHYLFVVESYMSMSKACYDCPKNITDCYRPHCLPADGMHKAVFVADRNLPGPYIQVCLGDKIMVDVRNVMELGSTSIHWHGLTQINSPYMDGVPFVTQCPILPGTTFRYRFKADQSGTYLWHSHSGAQRTDGLFGGLTIRAPPKWNRHQNLYDFDEHSMIMIDWKLQSGEEFALKNAYISMDNQITNNMVSTILVNGLGRYKNFAETDEEPLYVPSAVFNVKQGYKYRFRMVNAGAENCPIQMSIDNHTMTIISADGNDIVPIEVNSINSWPGERYDFIINADKAIDNYWIRYRSHGGLCNNKNNPTRRVHQVAILRYESADLVDPKSPVGWDIMPLPEKFKELNAFNVGVESEVPIVSLESLVPNDETANENVDQQLYISYDIYNIDNYQYQRSGLYGVNQLLGSYPDRALGSLQLNHIAFKMPPFPVLSQRNMITSKTFCNSTTVRDKDCINEFCACTHALQVKLNSTVELVIVDEGRHALIHHPMHLHGHSFRVVAMGKLEGPVTVERVKQLDREGKIKRTLERAPLKDTVRVPNGGYTVVRFYANNPGYWFFHCHFDEHVTLGMALVVKVGEDEDMLPVPNNFPQCGSYMPNAIAIIVADVIVWSMPQAARTIFAGYWFFHCHFDEHVVLGMALVFKVGEHEDMLPVPHNFPQCGSYMPNAM